MVNSSNSQLKEPLKSELPLLALRVFKYLRGEIERHEKLYNLPVPKPEITDKEWDKLYNF